VPADTCVTSFVDHCDVSGTEFASPDSDAGADRSVLFLMLPEQPTKRAVRSHIADSELGRAGANSPLLRAL
jgi:hypothetical protein